jgi:osmotically-inducible protein OsmY
VPSTESSKLYAPISDDMLKNAVEASFSRDPALRPQLLHVTAASGVVTLGGTVPTLAAKWRAVQLAGDFKGATSVTNGIRVSAPVPPLPDAEIVEELKNAIKSDPATRSASVEVTANQGTVSIRGTADSYAQRDLLGYAASGVRGVQEVNLAVTLSKTSAHGDAELTADVSDRLHDDARLDGSHLAVAVHGRDTVISGIVGTLVQQNAALEDAWLAGAGTVNARGVQVDWRHNLPDSAVVGRLPPPSDAHVADAVNRNLASDIRVDLQLPNVRVEKGVVTLSGNVLDFRAKNAAGRDARHVSGVWRVEDVMTVLPAKRQSDATIQRQVMSSVYNDVAVPDARNVRTMTAGAKVTLQGAVASLEEKRAIESDVEEVPGVIAVDDDLKVSGLGPDTHAMSPESLRHSVIDAIFWDPRIGFDKVTVEVTPAGDVTLNGLVGSWGEAHAATDDAIKTGAAHVDNRLGIVSP